MKTMDNEKLKSFENFLIEEEKSVLTRKKYIRDVNIFLQWNGNKKIDRSCILAYKKYLIEKYKLSSVNSMLSSLNSYFAYLKCDNLKVKTVKQQKSVYLSIDKELTKMEYFLLINEAEKSGNSRLSLLMQTICSTGIRVSELQYITVDSIEICVAEIMCKGKQRNVFLPQTLCDKLKNYCYENNIKSGPVFITKKGKPLDRSNIWTEMKKVSKSANILYKKVYPHNLRHLFARTYYESYRDIVRLADILGHCNVNTTRIYTMESGYIHKCQIQDLDLVVR